MKLAKRQPRFPAIFPDGSKCPALLRGFYLPQRAHPKQPMPARVKS